MAIVRRTVTVPAAGSIDVNLAPFDRFGGRGGRLAVRAAALAAFAASKTMTVLVGSDILADEMQISAELVIGAGPDSRQAPIVGFGAPADPITIRLFNTGAAEAVTVEADIQNA